MRKSFPVLFSLFLVSLVALSSCKKDGKVVATFTATMEDCADVHNVKTVLSSNALQWEEGDEIKIHSGNTAVFTATPLSPATKATFTTTDHNFNDAGSYIAYYPAEINGAFNQITLPTTQESEDGSLRGFPMHAYAENSNNLQFHNLCGVLKLNLQKTGVTVTSITLTMNEPINGTYYVNNAMSTSNIATLENNPINASNATTLVCNQSINEAHDFYIYLPAGTYTGLTLEITTAEGMVCTKGPATSEVVIERSKYSTLTLGSGNLEFLPIGRKGGLFTINEDGDQVWFSQGNLQYQASTGTWRFAENQYDYIGSDNSSISATYSGWIDLFGWGTGNSPTLNTNNYSDYHTFVDWGVNAISNSVNQSNAWRTLSWNEWDYILNNRANASDKKAIGNINGVGGLILLPDSWTLPLGCTFASGFSTFDENNNIDWTHNNYTHTQWSAMEVAGAVFLPAAGQRWGTNVGLVGSLGAYWSYSPNDDGYVCSMYFYVDIARINNRDFCILGRSVRLVLDDN